MNFLMTRSFIVLSCAGMLYGMDEQAIKAYVNSDAAQRYITEQLKGITEEVPYTRNPHTQTIQKSRWATLYENRTRANWSGKRKIYRVKQMLEAALTDATIKKIAAKNKTSAYLNESLAVANRLDFLYNTPTNEELLERSKWYAQDYKKYGDVETVNPIQQRRGDMIILIIKSLLFAEGTKYLHTQKK